MLIVISSSVLDAPCLLDNLCLLHRANAKEKPHDVILGGSWSSLLQMASYGALCSLPQIWECSQEDFRGACWIGKIEK